MKYAAALLVPIHTKPLERSSARRAASSSPVLLLLLLPSTDALSEPTSMPLMPVTESLPNDCRKSDSRAGWKGLRRW